MFGNIQTFIHIMEDEGTSTGHGHCVSWILSFYSIVEQHMLQTAYHITHLPCEETTDPTYSLYDYTTLEKICKLSSSYSKMTTCWKTTIFYHLWKKQLSLVKYNVILLVKVVAECGKTCMIQLAKTEYSMNI